MVAKKDAENVVPAVKKPRVARKAVVPKIDPTTQSVLDAADAVFEDPFVQITISNVTPGIPSRVRDVLYQVGFYLGIVASVAPVIAAAVTGTPAIALATIGAVALAFNSWLARANLSKTAEDIGRVEPTPAH